MVLHEYLISLGGFVQDSGIHGCCHQVIRRRYGVNVTGQVEIKLRAEKHIWIELNLYIPVLTSVLTHSLNLKMLKS